VRLLLDHCVDRRLSESLRTHEVQTAAGMGWEQLRNGELLSKAAAAGFEVVLTTDAKLRYQQNLRSLPVSVVVLRAVSNRLTDLLPLIPLLEAALATLGRGQLIEIGQPGKGGV
jgi:hypothetical protein